MSSMSYARIISDHQRFTGTSQKQVGEVPVVIPFAAVGIGNKSGVTQMMDTIAQYLPTETIGFFMGVIAVVNSAQRPLSSTIVWTIIFFGLIVTWFNFAAIMQANTEGSIKVLDLPIVDLVLITVSFFLWAMVVPGVATAAFSSWGDTIKNGAPLYLSIGAIFWSAVLPKIMAWRGIVAHAPQI